jgi:hypothetical protein
MAIEICGSDKLLEDWSPTEVTQEKSPAEAGLLRGQVWYFDVNYWAVVVATACKPLGMAMNDVVIVPSSEFQRRISPS